MLKVSAELGEEKKFSLKEHRVLNTVFFVSLNLCLFAFTCPPLEDLSAEGGFAV
jgi:hypothetical protein